MTALANAQAKYDLATPALPRASDDCTNLQTALYASLQESGFDVDGLEVEPDGEHELLVSCSPFPTISVTQASVREMAQEWVDEVSYRLLSVK